MAQGCPFTWKKRIHGSWIYERLDRGLARRDFCNLYPNLGALHGAFTFSDHCPIVLNTDPQDQYPKACPFRFQNFWTKYSHVAHTVKTKWRATEPGTHMYKFMRKLKSIKIELKPWVKSTFGNMQAKLRLNLEKITYIENKLLESPLSFRLNEWMNRMLK